MKVSVAARNRENKKMEHLRFKLGREIPTEELDECKTFAELNAKKKVYEAIEESHRHSRSHDERESLKRELVAEGLLTLPEVL